MKGDGGKAFRETHEVTSKYVDRVRETRRLQRIADGYPAERFTPSPVTYPTVAEECTDPSCARPALSDDVPWCARHRAAMLTGASSPPRGDADGSELVTAPSQFTVGTPVTYRNIEPRSTATIDATVVKVGRKWVYIDGDSVPWYIAAMAFDKLTGLSKEDYRGTSYERIETVEMRTAREHRERAELAIRDCWPMRGNDRLPPLRGPHHGPDRADHRDPHRGGEVTAPSIQEHLRLTPSDRIADQIRGIITRENRNHPRSLQKTLGPSEIGHPCSRKLVLHIIDAPQCNPGFDPLPSEIGIAYHARMERHMLAENMRLGRERYLTENRVTVWPAGVEGCEPALAGSADCYDIDEQRVLDWKILGNTSMDELRLRGPKTSYRRQIQLYGKGFELLGYPVKSVALVAIPKSGTTYGIKVYEYPYDPTVSDQVQARWHQLLVLADVLGVEKNPQMIAAIEATEETCEFCPFFSRTPDGSGYQCAGPAHPMNPAPTGA